MLHLLLFLYFLNLFVLNLYIHQMHFYLLYLHQHLDKHFLKLEEIMNKWSEGFTHQRDFFRDEIKYYFKFMQREIKESEIFIIGLSHIKYSSSSSNLTNSIDLFISIIFDIIFIITFITN